MCVRVCTYRIKVESSKKNWDDLPEDERKHGVSHCRLPISMLYSFDHVQGVHYPSNSLQPGPMYFKTARKCEIFGICCKGSLIQANYLIDEGVSIGKGANSIINMFRSKSLMSDLQISMAFMQILWEMLLFSLFYRYILRVFFMLTHNIGHFYA